MKQLLKIVTFLFLPLLFINGTESIHYQALETAGNGNELRKINNKAFKRGEVLKYRVHYGIMNAGEAVIQILEEDRKIGGRSTFHVVGTGYTISAFDWFYKVRDKYESYIDEDAILPWVFIRRVNEGGYLINQDYVFNHHKNLVDANGKIFSAPEDVQDMISAFYYARTIDFSNAKKGDVFSIVSFVDNEVFELKIKYVGKETIKSDIGKIRCIKFRPIVQQGRVFKKEEDLNVWITDDLNRIPVRAEAKILVGSVKMDLMQYSNLANPLALEK